MRYHVLVVWVFPVLQNGYYAVSGYTVGLYYCRISPLSHGTVAFHVIADYCCLDQRLPLFNCSNSFRICDSSCLWLSLISFNILSCSSVSLPNCASNFSCQGYRTKIWKHNAEDPITKLVREKPRVINIATAESLPRQLS